MTFNVIVSHEDCEAYETMTLTPTSDSGVDVPLLTTGDDVTIVLDYGFTIDLPTKCAGALTWESDGAGDGDDFIASSDVTNQFTISPKPDTDTNLGPFNMEVQAYTLEGSPIMPIWERAVMW